MGQHAGTNTQEAWSALLAEQSRANSALFYSLAYRVLRDRFAAEDACQKALLMAWDRRHDILDVSRLKGWLTAAVINESLAVLRRRKVEMRVMKLVAGQGGEGGAAASETPLDTEARREAIVLALAELEENQRVVVTLRVMQGMSGREVTALLGISDGQVSKLLHRGMECLRSTLAPWHDNNG